MLRKGDSEQKKMMENDIMMLLINKWAHPKQTKIPTFPCGNVGILFFLGQGAKFWPTPTFPTFF